nr:MAG TPA: hypothetical protein [Caudoviricetes sp.]
MCYLSYKLLYTETIRRKPHYAAITSNLFSLSQYACWAFPLKG